MCIQGVLSSGSQQGHQLSCHLTLYDPHGDSVVKELDNSHCCDSLRSCIVNFLFLLTFPLSPCLSFLPLFISSLLTFCPFQKRYSSACAVADVPGAVLQAAAGLRELQWAPEPGPAGTAGPGCREGAAAGNSTGSPPQGAGGSAGEVSNRFLLSACPHRPGSLRLFTEL